MIDIYKILVYYPILLNDYKTSLDREPSLQQQIYQYFNKKNPQSSLLKTMPSLQLPWKCQIKKDLKQNSIEKGFLDSEDENNGKCIQNSRTKYSLNTDKVIDYCNLIGYYLSYTCIYYIKEHQKMKVKERSLLRKLK